MIKIINKIINKMFNLKGIILTTILLTLSIIFEYIKRMFFKYHGINDINTYSNMGQISIKHNFLIKIFVSMTLIMINSIVLK